MRWQEMPTERGRRTRCGVALVGALLLSGCCKGRSAAPCPPPPAAVTATTHASSLTPEQRIAVVWIRRARAAEPRVTPLLREIAASQRADLAGLEHKIKTLSSTVSKLQRLRAKEPDTPLERLEVYDALRYTLVVPDDPSGHHDAAIRSALVALENAGHEVRKVKNYWPRGDSYSGTNCIVVTPDGLAWELQFHTPVSYGIKDAVHDDYDRMRDNTTPSAERRRLFESMKEMWETIPIPEGILVPGSLHAAEEIRLLPGP